MEAHLEVSRDVASMDALNGVAASSHSVRSRKL